MFTQYHKGQGIIGEIILFSISIFLAIMMSIFLSTDDAEFDKGVSEEIGGSMENIKDRSMLTTMLNDNIESSASVETDYEDLSAIELTSYYFSTNGEIRIHETLHDRDKVKGDLENYYKDKLNRNLRPHQEFHLNITESGSSYIEVDGTTSEYKERWNVVSVPLEFSNGDTGEIQLYVGGTGGVFDVE